MELKKHNDIKFLVREGTSDVKTFNEVIVKNAYEKKYFKINLGDNWIDLGGNVGAFAVNAISKGAIIDVYEPDPFSCKMIEQNLKINDYNANIIQKAVVSNGRKKMTMYVGNNKQVWRNSLYRDWGNEKFLVDCINFRDVIKQDSNVKMDIEGAEMEILEKMITFPKRITFEWSFDIDNSLNRYRNVITNLKEIYRKVHAAKYKDEFQHWQQGWFPPCTTVFCYEKY